MLVSSWLSQTPRMADRPDLMNCSPARTALLQTLGSCTAVCFSTCIMAEVPHSYTPTQLMIANGTADSLNNNDLAITIFAPTNEAWAKRLPTLTQANKIEAHDLFSIGKADALRGIMQYHMTATVIKVCGHA